MAISLKTGAAELRSRDSVLHAATQTKIGKILGSTQCAPEQGTWFGPSRSIFSHFLSDQRLWPLWALVRPGPKPGLAWGGIQYTFSRPGYAAPAVPSGYSRAYHVPGAGKCTEPFPHTNTATTLLWGVSASLHWPRLLYTTATGQWSMDAFVVPLHYGFLLSGPVHWIYMYIGAVWQCRLVQ